MATADELLLRINLNSAAIAKGLKKVDKGLDKVGKTAKKSGMGMGKMFAAFAAGTIVVKGLSRAFNTASRAVKQFGAASIKAASENEIAVKKFDRVFRGVVDTANVFRDELTGAYGLATTEATIFMSAMQDMLVPMGMAREQATKLSGEMVKLSVDLAAFTPGSSVQQGMQAMQSALAGMFRPLRNFGVFLDEAAIKARALQKGLDPKTLTASQKAMVIFELTLEGSSDALGAAARNADTFTEASRRLKSQFENLQNTFGDTLIGPLGVAAQSLTESIKTLDEFISKNKELIEIGVTAWLMSMANGMTAFQEQLTNFKLGMSGIINLLERAFADSPEEAEKLRAAFAEIGEATVGVSDAMSELNDNLQKDLLESMKQLREDKAGKEALQELADFMKFMGEETERTNGIVNNLSQDGLSLLVGKFLDLSNNVRGNEEAVDSLTTKFWEMLAPLSQPELFTFLESLESVSITSETMTETVFDLMLQFGELTEGLGENSLLWDGINKRFEKFLLLAEKAKKANKGIKEGMLDTAKTAGKTFNLASQVVQGFAMLTANAFQELGATGKVSAKGLAGAFIGMIADIAIAMGTFYVMAGLGIEAMNVASGAGTVAAGIALLAIGGVLKGAASSLSGESAAPIGSSGEGLAGFTGAGFDDDEEDEIAVQEEPMTSVVLNITGADLVPEDEWERISRESIVPAIRRGAEDENVVVTTEFDR
ncbi:hypothetical protein N9937_00550 [bacterium]|nr:hypothetical protein [bacterium]